MSVILICGMKKSMSAVPPFKISSVAEIAGWKGLSADERMLLITIRQQNRMRDRSDEHRGWAKVPVSQLTEDTGYGKKLINKMVLRLATHQVLEKYCDESHGPNNPCRYRIHRQKCCFKAKD